MRQIRKVQPESKPVETLNRAAARPEPQFQRQRAITLERRRPCGGRLENTLAA
jgi:hypothetical protein